MSERPVRGCDICAQVDNHPRHVMGVPADFPGAVPSDDVLDRLEQAGIPGRALREQLDPLTVVRHFDCCAQVGCLDGSCDQVLAEAGDKRREALVKHVEANVRRLDKERG